MNDYRIKLKKLFAWKYFSIALTSFFSITILFILFWGLNLKTYFINENTDISKSKYLFGIDISHHQGKINWSAVKTSHHPIKYIFIKSTESKSFKDPMFKRNWQLAKKHGYIRGAYHFYDPNVNSKIQFANFKNSVKLQKGDFPPILDIEVLGRLGKRNLVKGVLNWLKLAEREYGVKPVIYTGRTFYKDNLKGYVKKYPLWIASYSSKHKLKGVRWNFHQFTERVKIKGISSLVDGNDFNGTLTKLKSMCKN